MKSIILIEICSLILEKNMLGTENVKKKEQRYGITIA